MLVRVGLVSGGIFRRPSRAIQQAQGGAVARAEVRTVQEFLAALTRARGLDPSGTAFIAFTIVLCGPIFPTDTIIIDVPVRLEGAALIQSPAAIVLDLRAVCYISDVVILATTSNAAGLSFQTATSQGSHLSRVTVQAPRPLIGSVEASTATQCQFVGRINADMDDASFSACTFATGVSEAIAGNDMVRSTFTACRFSGDVTPASGTGQNAFAGCVFSGNSLDLSGTSGANSVVGCSSVVYTPGPGDAAAGNT